MKNKEEKNDSPVKPELTPVEPKAAAPKAGKVEAKPAPQKKAPGKFSRFMQRLLRGIAFAVFFIAVGVLIGYMGLQRPAESENSTLVNALEETKSALEMQVADLEGQVSELQDEVDSLTALEEVNAELEESLAAAEKEVLVLSILRDIQSAKLALSDEEADVANFNLSETAEKLEALRALLPAEQHEKLDGMLQRLDLAIAGLDTDLLAAESDLAVLENSLVTLEK